MAGQEPLLSLQTSEANDGIQRTLQRRETLNPIKLKLMTMRMRHRFHGRQFRRQRPGDDYPYVPSWPQVEPAGACQQQAPIRGPSSVRTATITGLVDTVIGPNNKLGLETIFYHPFSILLVASPLGFYAFMADWSVSWTFWLNFLALVPLAKILGDATEELAGSINNDTVTGLLNATFGNAVEMIVSIQSIRRNLLSIVKASLLGSVLSNILLVLGTSFLCGGLSSNMKQRGRHHSYHVSTEVFKASQGGVMGGLRIEKEQKFGMKGALISIAMLLFSCMSFALPTIFNAYPSDDSKSVLQVSRIGACIVLSSYVAYLLFQLFTHERTLASEGEGEDDSDEEGDDEEDIDEDEELGASLTVWCSLLLMFITTLAVALNSEALVDSIESVVQKEGIPASFIGVILLPIAGNACEHASAIRFAIQDRPGLAIGIAVGSSTQIALLVVPFSVLVGWAVDKPLNLDFGLLNTAVVTFCILVLLALLLDGRSNWFKGYLLVSMYAFLSVLYWFVPQAIQSSTV